MEPLGGPIWGLAAAGAGFCARAKKRGISSSVSRLHVSLASRRAHSHFTSSIDVGRVSTTTQRNIIVPQPRRERPCETRAWSSSPCARERKIIRIVSHRAFVVEKKDATRRDRDRARDRSIRSARARAQIRYRRLRRWRDRSIERGDRRRATTRAREKTTTTKRKEKKKTRT